MFNLSRIANQAVKAVKKTIDHGQKEAAKAAKQASKQASGVSRGASQFVRSAQSSAQQAMSQAAKQQQAVSQWAQSAATQTGDQLGKQSSALMTAAQQQGAALVSEAQKQGQSAFDRAKTVAKVAGGGGQLSSNFVSPTQAWDAAVSAWESTDGFRTWAADTAGNTWNAGVNAWNATEGARNWTMNTGEVVFDYVKNLVTSDEAWGEAIGVDDGKSPRPFGYGTHGHTILEGYLGQRRERETASPYNSQEHGLFVSETAAKLRLFGDASWQTLSASLGIETENGLRSVETHRGRVTQPNIRLDIDWTGTFRKNVENWSQDLGAKLAPPTFQINFNDGRPSISTAPSESSSNGFSNFEMVYTGEAPEAPRHDQTVIDERFLGLRGRMFGEAGVLGVSLGSEAFLGLQLNGATVTGEVGEGDYWRVDQSQLDIGLRNSNLLHADIAGFDAFTRFSAGIGGRLHNAEHFPVFGDLGVVHSNDAFAFAGATYELGMSGGATGIEGGVDAFVGVSAGIRKQLGLAWDGYEFGHVYGDVQTRAGVGVIAKADVDYSVPWTEPWNWDVGANIEFGVVAGVGGSASLGFGLFGKDLYEHPVAERDATVAGGRRELGLDLP